jgi:hypothetical protein
MRLGTSLAAAALACALTASTLFAQELPMDTPYDQNDGPRIIDPDQSTLLVAAPDELVQSIRLDAGQRVGIDPATVQISASQPVDWSDASLGCPQHEVAYAQVITPGFLIVVEAGGNHLNYHTDAGGRFVVCDGPPPRLGAGI